MPSTNWIQFGGSCWKGLGTLCLTSLSRLSTDSIGRNILVGSLGDSGVPSPRVYQMENVLSIIVCDRVVASVMFTICASS